MSAGQPRVGTGRKDGLRLAVAVRLALAGTKTDALRVLLTAFSTALAVLGTLSALTVLAVADPNRAEGDGAAALSRQYTSELLREPGLRPGVAIALVMLTVPVLTLAGQCARIGAPARDRRLAAVRMAGATPRQAVTIASAETGMSSLLGALAGFGGYLALHKLLHRPDAQGHLPLPTDVMPSPVALASVVLGLPLLATLLSALMLRSVTLSPFGITRRVRRGTPRPWPGVLILLGFCSASLAEPLQRRYPESPWWLTALMFFGGVVFTVAGVVLGTGWISCTAGRVLHRFARRPAALLAARRLQDDPWNGSRTFAALLACLVFGAGAAAIRAGLVAQNQADAAAVRLETKLTHRQPDAVVQNDSFYFDTMDLISTAVIVAMTVAVMGLLIALAESVLSRRRTHAALVATGVPRRVLGRVLAWQTFAPIVPASLLALAVGTMFGRATFSEGRSLSSTTPKPGGGEIHIPEVVRQAQVPVEELALYGLVTVALLLTTVGVGLLFLRNSTDPEEIRTT